MERSMNGLCFLVVGPIVGQHVAVIFVTKKVTIATV